jgi:hypothetical protein
MRSRACSPCAALFLALLALPGWTHAIPPPSAAQPLAASRPWHMAEGPAGPSTPTTDQLFREIAGLRTLLETRMDASDKTQALLQALHEEKFRSLDARLLAARAALADAQDATETLRQQAASAMQKQLDQVTDILKHADTNVNERLLGLKERLDRLEGQASGVGTSWAVGLGLIGLLGGLVTLGAAVRRGRGSAAG